MPDFMLEPDELDPECPDRRRPVRLVATGLADTAEGPTTRTKDKPPAYTACPQCRQAVLTGQTRAGTPLVLAEDVPTYCVVWPKDATQPVHGCVPAALTH